MSDSFHSNDENRAFSLTIMKETLSSVLQEQAFMFTEHEEDDGDTPTPSPPYQCARIAFDGPCAGRLGLIFPQSLLYELINNMLGIEAEKIDKEDISDALMELLNIVCGKFLVATFGPNLKFNLTMPTVFEMNLSEWEMQKMKPDTTVILVEDEPVLFELYL